MKYVDALNQALKEVMRDDSSIILIGQGVTSPWYVGGSTAGLAKLFPKRVMDTPVSESAVTGMAAGAALSGLHPIVVHPRQDFTWLAMDAIANQIANWGYLFGKDIPIVIWSIINRGGSQGAQHSQNLSAVYCHIPCLTVVAPSSPQTASGLLKSSVRHGAPVVFVDDRWLYNVDGRVSSQETTIGKASVVKRGKDFTVVASSWLTSQVLFAVDSLEFELEMDVEIVDLLTYKPLDIKTVIRSAHKTMSCLVVDAAWDTCGLASEIISRVAQAEPECQLYRLTLPDLPAPVNTEDELSYYVSASSIGDRLRYMFRDKIVVR